MFTFQDPQKGNDMKPKEMDDGITANEDANHIKQKSD